MTDTNKEIREAYEEARLKQATEYPKPPRWEELPLEMREVFISNFYDGRNAAAPA
jgi:hypothetical protein